MSGFNKGMSVVRNSRKAVQKINHRNRVRTHIPAQMAHPGPPLGSQLGQVGINISTFVKDFNLRTSIYKEGVPIPCNITVNPDRSYNLEMSHPPMPFLVKQAAGIQRGAMHYRSEVVGMITRKHVYEIAKLKSEDPLLQMVDLKVICDKVIDAAYSCGIKVVDEIDPDEYGMFLEERKKVNAQQRAELDEAREAKLLRT